MSKFGKVFFGTTIIAIIASFVVYRLFLDGRATVVIPIYVLISGLAVPLTLGLKHDNQRKSISRTDILITMICTATILGIALFYSFVDEDFSVMKRIAIGTHIVSIMIIGVIMSNDQSRVSYNNRLAAWYCVASNVLALMGWFILI